MGLHWDPRQAPGWVRTQTRGLKTDERDTQLPDSPCRIQPGSQPLGIGLAAPDHVTGARPASSLTPSPGLQEAWELFPRALCHGQPVPGHGGHGSHRAEAGQQGRSPSGTGPRHGEGSLARSMSHWGDFPPQAPSRQPSCLQPWGPIPGEERKRYLPRGPLSPWPAGVIFQSLSFYLFPW